MTPNATRTANAPTICCGPSDSENRIHAPTIDTTGLASVSIEVTDTST